ncbi:inosine/xanthosine triphosphatase [Virgibacillus subterraneus]|uniref:inosine/xanthosine triphosphatase n=1 Tax=Virgibacillus subterraneus TaxID=621109 RepID=A0A1H9D777_9BACI|nr:DUF84 family protein [Virgibacillus subterraneus]SEQ09310.1 inosine/xanthosine triphosphatase [Virgibacillus subterraneus]
MEVIIGSKNPTKRKAVEEVFLTDIVTGYDVPSKVSAQPLSDSETREGAMNRAMQCIETTAGKIGIGLEGGVMQVDDQLYLCNWGALVTREKEVFTASGARILLPDEFNDQLQGGAELGDIMDTYAKRKDVRKNEGAIGIFTNDHISRKEMFVHVVKLLHGQWEYAMKNSSGS